MANLAGSNDLIVTLIANEYEISDARVSSSAFTPIKVRLERRLTRCAKRLAALRDWTFRYIEDDVTVLANTSSIALPGEWENEGREGGVWLRFGGAAGESRRLSWRRSGEILNLLETTTQRGDPTDYTVTGGYNLRVWPFRESEAMPIHVYFHSTAPAIDADNDPGGLDFFPSRHYDLLYEMVKLEDMPHYGDLAARQIQADVVKEMIADMVISERQGKPEPDFLPRYPGAADVWGNEDSQ